MKQLEPIGARREYENELIARDATWPEELEGVDFTDCTIVGAELRSFRLRRCRFFDCRFERVDASAADWTDCTLRGVTFYDSKLLGINWTLLQSLATTRWERSNLDGSSFQALELEHGEWLECSAREADFSECKLKKAKLCGCQLEGANFNGADLTQTDFSGSSGLSLLPQHVRLKATVIELEALLRMAKELGLKIAGQ
ncbi:MAG TPA: pentapeptide repeat-containing protein [Polyangiaceae bacterium]|nr:pentapeptide repeat-containing protein [Polyangiaceae bacterium]